MGSVRMVEDFGSSCRRTAVDQFKGRKRQKGDDDHGDQQHQNPLAYVLHGIISLPGQRQHTCRALDLLGVMDRGQVHHIDGIELVSLQPVPQNHQVRQVLDVDIGGVFRQVPLHLFVELCLLCVVGRGLGLLEQGVIVRVLIVDKVVVRRRGEPLQQRPGSHVGGVYAYHGGLELPVSVHLAEPGTPLHRLNLRGDAHGLQLLHQHSGRVDVGLIVG